MARAIKYFKFLIHISILILGSYFIKHKSVKPVVLKKLGRYLPDIRYFLLWTDIPGLEHEGQKHFVNNRCEYVNCYLTKNKTFLEDIRYFDGILFNLQEVSGQYIELPKTRSMTQKYIFTANNSADNYPVCNSLYDDFFNWTWTYRLDSTVQYRFFSFAHLNTEIQGYHLQWIYSMKPVDPNFKGILSSKSKAAAIFLNNCQTRSKREKFLENLQTQLARFNLTVDVYGNCGPFKCGRRSMNSCLYKLKKTYYFYLALEDSISLDYVTDCVLYAYENYAVPIVYGGAPYRRYLPPHSYLNGMNVGEDRLAEKMYEIIRNKERYYDYFRWRNHYTVKKSPVLDPCELCQTFNNPSWLFHKISYVKFREWWNPKYEERCGISKRFLFL